MALYLGSEKKSKANVIMLDGYSTGYNDAMNELDILKTSASGEVIAIRDALPIAHDLNVKVTSKNLINVMPIASYNNATDFVQDEENNSFTLRGNEGNGQFLAATGQVMLPYTSGSVIAEQGIKVKGGLTYAISFDYLLLEPGKYNNYISMVVYTETLSTIPCTPYAMVQGVVGETVRGSMYINPTEDCTIGICFRINNNYVTISNIQVEEGATATTYTPYVEDLDGVKVYKYGKNLFNGELKVWNNLDRIMPKEAIKVAPNTQYTVSVPDYTIRHPIFAVYGNHTGTVGATTDTNLGAMVTTFNSGEFEYIWFRQWYPMTDDGITLESKVQLEVGSTTTEYEPYKNPDIALANSDGTVKGLTNISPNMTLFTDTEGAVINLKYFRDVNLALENQALEIAMSGGE